MSISCDVGISSRPTSSSSIFFRSMLSTTKSSLQGLVFFTSLVLSLYLVSIVKSRSVSRFLGTSICSIFSQTFSAYGKVSSSVSIFSLEYRSNGGLVFSSRISFPSFFYFSDPASRVHHQTIALPMSSGIRQSSVDELCGLMFLKCSAGTHSNLFLASPGLVA